MLDIAVARKYARALFEASTKQGNVERVHADLEAIDALRDEDPSFLGFLVSPEEPNDRKHAFIGAVFEPRVDPLVTGFLRLLVEKGRIVNLPAICVEYRTLSEEARGVLRAEVVTAVSLGEDHEARLREELGAISGKEILLEKRVDPAILGGVIVHLGEQIIDRSIRRGLRTMADALLAAEPGPAAH